MALYNHPLKRLKDSLHSHSSLPNDELIRESVENFSSSSNNDQTKIYRSFKPAPYRARRGGGQVRDRHWFSSGLLPKRTINYDLAESFTDHSTNPLSSNLYKIRFKHSAKQWPNGRFINYKEKLDRLDENIIDITCARTFPIVSKRKKNEKNIVNTTTTTTTTTLSSSTSSIVLVDPISQEQKKKLADKQTNFYANLFGSEKIFRFASTNHIKKTNSISNSIKSTTQNSLFHENKEDQKC